MRRGPLPPAGIPGLLPAITILVALLPLLAAEGRAEASGGLEVRRQGASWARIEDGGNIRVEGRLVGSIDEDGDVRVAGRLSGRVDEGGTIRENGRMAGTVEKDGTIRSAGTLLGRVEKDGTIRRQGAQWGSASPCCSGFRDVRRVTALLFFFDRGFFGP
jgi:hypothetical protein